MDLYNSLIKETHELTDKLPAKVWAYDPKAARDKFGLKAGDRLVVASDEHGIALLPADFFISKMQELMEKLNETCD